METKEITENNKLIAEFMESKNYQAIDSKKYFCIEHPSVIYFNRDCKSCKFHSSWDWLMPVVQKTMQTDMHSEGIENLLDAMTSAFHNVSIDELYKAVIEFINWYNLQNN